MVKLYCESHPLISVKKLKNFGFVQIYVNVTSIVDAQFMPWLHIWCVWSMSLRPVFNSQFNYDRQIIFVPGEYGLWSLKIFSRSCFEKFRCLCVQLNCHLLSHLTFPCRVICLCIKGSAISYCEKIHHWVIMQIYHFYMGCHTVCSVKYTGFFSLPSSLETFC